MANIHLRFPRHIIEESKELREGRDPLCPDYSMYMITEESLFSSIMPYTSKQVESIIRSHFGNKRIKNILDATAHVGCDTINFRSRFGANCISIEIDPIAYECLVQNQKTFTKEQLKTTRSGMDYSFEENYSINCNCIEFIQGFKKQVDFVYFDPPWGGPNYWRQKDMMLYLDYKERKYPIYTIVNNVFKEGFTKTVIVKTPRNFNIRLFIKELTKDAKCRSYKVFKQKKKKTKTTRVAFFITVCSII